MFFDAEGAQTGAHDVVVGWGVGGGCDAGGVVEEAGVEGRGDASKEKK